MITHHPEDNLLLDFAAGALPEAVAISLATHASICRRCAVTVNWFEAIGGVMVERAPDRDDVSEFALEATFRRLDEEAAESVTPAFDDETMRIVPTPLRRRLCGNLRDLPWKRVSHLFSEHRLDLRRSGFKATLIRIEAGAQIPKHSHRGQEYTVVLDGGYRDGDARFARGDFNAKSQEDWHQPVVDPDGPCLCLAILDAPVRLSGVVGFLVNPFLRI